MKIETVFFSLDSLRRIAENKIERMKQPQKMNPPVWRKAGRRRRKVEVVRQPALMGIQLAWIQCKGYRCLAYSDESGKWINFYTGKKTTHFIRVIG